MKRTLAIVVTYNRKEMLYENLTALFGQSFEDFDVLVVDNASTDGTEDVVAEFEEEHSGLFYHNMGENTGGAGGFAYGVGYACEKGYDFCWLMDDDTIPEKEAFISLCRKANRLKGEFAFIGSMVKWTDGSPAVMNMMDVRKDWYKKERYIKEGLVPVAWGSFVSLFIKTDLVRKCGLPIEEFFIYGDDVEYTERLAEEATGYIDLDSIVIHKTKNNKGFDPAEVPTEKIPLCYYDSRNRFYIAKRNGVRGICAYVYYQLLFIARIVLSDKPDKEERIKAVIKGTIEGLFFNPKIKGVTNG